MSVNKIGSIGFVLLRVLCCITINNLPNGKEKKLPIYTGVAEKIVHFYLLHTVNKSGLSSLPPLYNSIKNYRIFSPLAGLQKRSKFHEVQSSMETDFILTGNEP